VTIAFSQAPFVVCSYGMRWSERIARCRTSWRLAILLAVTWVIGDLGLLYRRPLIVLLALAVPSAGLMAERYAVYREPSRDGPGKRDVTPPPPPENDRAAIP